MAYDYIKSYHEWCAQPGLDEDIRLELAQIAQDDAAIQERFYAPLTFGTAGLRGILGAGTGRMNRYMVARATQGLSEVILKSGQAARGVVIAFDSRRYSDKFALEAALTLCANGIPAFLFESLRPVPVLSFTVRHLSAIAGIVITASHNAAAYNGYKVYWEDGAQMPPDEAGQVLSAMNALPEFGGVCQMTKEEALARGLLHYIGKEVDDAYIEKVKGLTLQPDVIQRMADKLRIIYTPVYGSGNVPVRRVLGELGWQVRVVEEQAEPNSDFPGISAPNPQNLEVFDKAIEIAEQEGADLLLATDPDCDRLGVAYRVNGRYTVMTGNQIGCFLLYYICDRLKARGTLPKDGFAVKTIVSTEMARAIAESYGLTLIEVLTGFKFIAEQIKLLDETGKMRFLFGFEESYGYLAGTFVRDKDAVIAAMLMTEAAAYYKEQGKTFSDALESMYSVFGYYMEETIDIELEGVAGLQQIPQLMSNVRNTCPESFGGKKVLAIRDYSTGSRRVLCIDAPDRPDCMNLPQTDAVYYELQNNGWVCIRPSGTEPKVKNYLAVRGDDAQTAAAAMAALKTDYIAWINALRPRD